MLYKVSPYMPLEDVIFRYNNLKETLLKIATEDALAHKARHEVDPTDDGLSDIRVNHFKHMRLASDVHRIHRKLVHYNEQLGG